MTDRCDDTLTEESFIFDTEHDYNPEEMILAMSRMKPGTELHEIEELCRCCMNVATEDCFEIFEDYGEVLELKNVCDVLMETKIDFDNRIFHKICLQCVADLKICQRMMEQLKYTEQYLKAVVKYSLFIKSENSTELSCGESQDVHSINKEGNQIPRKAMVMTLETFLTNFDGSKQYFENTSGLEALNYYEDFSHLDTEPDYSCVEVKQEPENESYTEIVDSENGTERYSADPNVNSDAQTCFMESPKPTDHDLEEQKDDECIRPSTSSATKTGKETFLLKSKTNSRAEVLSGSNETPSAISNRTETNSQVQVNNITNTEVLMVDEENVMNEEVNDPGDNFVKGEVTILEENDVDKEVIVLEENDVDKKVIVLEENAIIEENDNNDFEEHFMDEGVTVLQVVNNLESPKRKRGRPVKRKRKVDGYNGFRVKRPYRLILPKPDLLNSSELNNSSVDGLDPIDEYNSDSQDSNTYHRCKFCLLSVKGEKTLRDHYNEEHGDNRYQCLQCDLGKEGFETRTELSNHLVGFHKCKCSQCRAVFYSQARLTRHIAAKHDLSTDCKICGKVFKNPHRRKMHTYTHKKKILEICWFCGKSVNKKNFVTHLEKHFEQTYECNICNKTCKSKTTLMNHRKRHFQSEEVEKEEVEANFTCNVCPRKFVTEVEMNRHSSSHLPYELRKPLVCKLCGKRFTRMKSFEAHDRERLSRGGTCRLKVVRGAIEVTEDPSHPCDVCGRLFIKPENVTRHRKYHFCDGDPQVLKKLLEDPEVYKCEICNRYFFSKITIQYHMSKHTGDKEPFKCDFCGKSCKSHHQMKLHERNHTGERPFTCRHCGRGFLEVKTCRAHEATHAKDKPFPCKSCSKWFKSRKQLVSHSRTHIDASFVRPHACTFCNRQFILKRDLQAHISKYHSSDKSIELQLNGAEGGFACSECGRVFAVESYCKKHMRLVHGIRFVHERHVRAEEEFEGIIEIDGDLETENVEEYFLIEDPGTDQDHDTSFVESDEVVLDQEVQYVTVDGSGNDADGVSFVVSPVEYTV